MKLIKKIVLLWALLFAAPVVAAPSDFLEVDTERADL